MQLDTQTKGVAHTADEPFVDKEARMTAQAAAKKAKKLRQKAKKQQQQLQLRGAAEDSEASSQSAVLPQGCDLQQPSTSQQHSGMNSQHHGVVVGQGVIDEHDSDLGEQGFYSRSGLPQRAQADSCGSSFAGNRLAHEQQSTPQQRQRLPQDCVQPDTDADQLQQLFCCPLTKVVPHLLLTKQHGMLPVVQTTPSRHTDLSA